MAVGASEVEILKPRCDKREYRRIVLPNSLEVLIISDPETDKAAASMNVSVGSFSDPDGLEGLAHFLEHMLFYASEKYPVEDSYSKYISEHGGSTNAFTSSENTNFHFDVNVDCFEEALDRFAQFFISPLMSPDATIREIKAVDSENQKNLLSDAWRMSQLQKHLSSENHPYHKFSTASQWHLSIEHGDASGSIRRWEELPYDALKCIFRFLPVDTVLIASCVCPAWQMSASRSLFLRYNALNLRLMDDLQLSSKLQFVKLLDITLSLEDCPWELVISPRTVAVPNSVFLDIARRTPKFRVAFQLSRFTLSLDKLVVMVDHWHDLKLFEALLHRRDAATALTNLGTTCKKIMMLSLRTRIGIREAKIIVEHFSALKGLRIPNCMLTIEAVNLILDGLRLKVLNMKHAYFVDEDNEHKNLTGAIIERAAAGVENFTYCGDPDACDECWTEFPILRCCRWSSKSTWTTLSGGLELFLSSEAYNKLKIVDTDLSVFTPHHNSLFFLALGPVE